MDDEMPKISESGPSPEKNMETIASIIGIEMIICFLLRLENSSATDVVFSPISDILFPLEKVTLT